MTRKYGKVGLVIGIALVWAVVGLVFLKLPARADDGGALVWGGGHTGADVTHIAATMPLTSVLDLHRDVYLGQTVVVTGYYVLDNDSYLAQDYTDFEANSPLPPYSYARLRGSVPGSAYHNALLVVTGTVGAYAHNYAHLGVAEGRMVTITEWTAVQMPLAGTKELAASSVDRTNPQPASPQQAADCECKWAFILSGGLNDDNNHARYWNDVVQKWEYKRTHAEYPEECISVFYYTGTAKTADVPAGRVMTATEENVTQALAALAPEMQACKERGIKPTLQFLVTDHGTGYHNANQGAGHNKLGLGGKVDTDGDEGGDHDGIQESDLRVDATDLPAGQGRTHDLYPGDGQSPDTWVGWQGGNVTIWRCLTPTCPPNGWTVVAQDTNGDQIIDSTDGGINLNGDGDTTDRVSFDEGINLLDGHVLTDDELYNALTPLCPSGVDLYVEMAQCYGGGFMEDLARLRAAGCHVHFVAAASEAEESWGTGGPNGYDYFEKHFIDRLTHLITTTGSVTVTPDMWQDAADTAAANPESQRRNTNPVDDIDCLILIGPYLKDGQMCIKVINYCENATEARLKLSAHNWGIGITPTVEYTATVPLQPGEMHEWCRPLPDEPGTYSIFGRAAKSGPYAYYARWLSNQRVVQEEPSSNAVHYNFMVGGRQEMPGGQQVYTYPLVILEPVPWLPEGWDFELSPPYVYEGVWVQEGPVPVTLTLYPAPSSMPGEGGGVWLHGWGVEPSSLSRQLPDVQQMRGTQQFPKENYLGFVLAEILVEPEEPQRIYLPLVMRQ